MRWGRSAVLVRAGRIAVFTTSAILALSMLVPSGAGSVPAVVRSPASGLTPRAPVFGYWYTNPDSLIDSLAGSPTLAASMWNRVDSYEWLDSFPDGWVTTPYANYGSYTQFAADLDGGIVPPVKVLMYDPELWNRDAQPPELQMGFQDPLRAMTPVEEQKHPAVYMKKFGILAHSKGYFVIEAPGLNLMNVVGGDCVHGVGEGLIAAYLRCRMPAAAALESDAIDVQFQSIECEADRYGADVATGAKQAVSVNADVQVLSGLSSGWCHPTGEQLLAAYKAVVGSVSGHFIAIPSNLVGAVDFYALLAPVTVGDGGFSPLDQIQMPGVTSAWRVAWNAHVQHTITDRSGLGLFDSGLRKAGYVFRYRFPGAGIYTATDTTDGKTATISVPVQVSPPSGTLGTTFTVTVATDQAPSGYVYQRQILRPGASDWASWGTGISGTFKPDAGVGTYSFRARLYRSSNGAASGWSPPTSIEVVA